MKRFSFSILIVKELYTFTRNILGIVSVPLKDNFLVKSLTNSLTDALSDLERAMGRALSSDYTSILIDKDKIRDEVFMGFRDYVDSFTRNRIQAKSIAALYLWKIFENIGITVYRHPYAIETAELNSLISYLKEPEASAALTTIGGTEWLDQLIAAQADFEASVNEKTDVESDVDIPLAAVSKASIVDHLDSLLNYIHAMEEYDKVVFSPLKLQIEEVCTDTIGRARSRITIAAREKKKETKGTVNNEIQK